MPESCAVGECQLGMCSGPDFCGGCCRCTGGCLSQLQAAHAAVEEQWLDTTILKYWAEFIGPGLQRSGMPEDGMNFLRGKYLEDVKKNPKALEQIKEWWANLV